MSQHILSIPTHINIALEFEIANIGKRSVAFVIDMLVKVIYFISVSVAFGGNQYVMSLAVVPFLLYSFLFEWLNKGQTPGKWLMKIRVISVEGNLPSVYQCATRWLFNLVDVWSLMLLSFLNPVLAMFGIFSPFLGLIMIAVMPKNQRLGDMAANTVLISTREQQVGLEDTIIAYADYRQSYEPQFPEVMRLSDNDINKIKYYNETAGYSDSEIISMLSRRIKEVLGVETSLNDSEFLKRLLTDYNHYAKETEELVS